MLPQLNELATDSGRSAHARKQPVFVRKLLMRGGHNIQSACWGWQAIGVAMYPMARTQKLLEGVEFKGGSLYQFVSLIHQNIRQE